MKFHLRTAIALAMAILVAHTSIAQVRPSIIPLPSSISMGTEHLRLPSTPTIQMPQGLADTLGLGQLVGDVLGTNYTTTTTASKGYIRLRRDKSVREPEGYRLSVSKRGIDLSASTGQGLRHGLQTLRQLRRDDGAIQHATISDAPRFGYRGVMLDVSRHMVPVDYILRLLDELARLKFNRFHWHLVDGAGWRMESKIFPLLTERSAWRTVSDWDTWWHGGDRRFTTKDAPGAYGGYYTQSEIRRVVEHAERLGITVVPEIELPGHSGEIFQSYPEIFCLDKYDPSITDVCIGNEKTFDFFEKILDETISLFPSQYIHIGGDEAAMNHWGDCPKCQSRMRQEGLKDLHELQSYMIKRIERHLISRGRRMIGWDEILMGGLAPEATVMSWRGEEGGIKAAKSGHDVIMTPNNYLYLDYYQSTLPSEPRAIGGYVSLEKVYSYNPEPHSLTAQEKKHVLGVQANLWTEYIDTPDHVSYMLFPRIIALSEIAWTPQAKRNYADFRRRATPYSDALPARGIKAYPLHGITTDVRASKDRKQVTLTLRPERADVQMRYTTDGSTPTASSRLYRQALSTADSLNVKIGLFKGEQPLYTEPIALRLDRHLAMDAKITYACAWNAKYPAGGERTLIDGTRGTPTYLDGLWQGFTEPMDVTIDLGKVCRIGHIYSVFLQEREQWVYMPREVEVFISRDGKNYESLGIRRPSTSEMNPRPVQEQMDWFTSSEARFIRMKATIGRSAGHFIFTDEIVVQ